MSGYFEAGRSHIQKSRCEANEEAKDVTPAGGVGHLPEKQILHFAYPMDGSAHGVPKRYVQDDTLCGEKNGRALTEALSRIRERVAR